MIKNSEIASKVEQIKSTVTSYVYANMNDEFKDKMYSQNGSHAAFKTASGLDVEFGSYRIGMDRYAYVLAKGQLNGTPIQFDFESSMFDYGTGSISSGIFGIAFWNVGSDEVEPPVNPYIDNRGRKVYLFAG